jgi:hypothetical protein
MLKGMNPIHLKESLNLKKGESIKQAILNLHGNNFALPMIG